MFCLLFSLFILIPPLDAIYKYEDFREEDVVGLQDFLSKLDERTQELIIELLEAKQIENMDDQNRRMRNIMREQGTTALDSLIELYKETGPKSCSAPTIFYIVLAFLSFHV